MSSFDIIGYGPDGAPTVIVETKSRKNTDPEWASGYRRNLLAYGERYKALFALVVPDRIYTWRKDAPPDAPPDAEIDARRILESYFERAHVEPARVHGSAFEQLVAWWLEDMARDGQRDADPKLRTSGLADAVKGARIVREVAA